MNKKGLVVVVAFCLIAAIVTPMILAYAANDVNSIISRLYTIQGTLNNLYSMLWSATDSVKNDTLYIRMHMTNTTTNLGEYTLPPGAAVGFYQILMVKVPAGKAAQFTVTVGSEEMLDATLNVWVDVNGDNWANMPALQLDLESMIKYGTVTFVGNWFSLRVDVNSPPSSEKQINWAYMVVAPTGVEVTEAIYSPP